MPAMTVKKADCGFVEIVPAMTVEREELWNGLKGDELVREISLNSVIFEVYGLGFMVKGEIYFTLGNQIKQ